MFSAQIDLMRMGPFISLVSNTYGIPEGSVLLIARNLREAGWLTTGARGVNAPEMTPTDAARLTVALLSGEPPGTVVAEFEFLRQLQAKDAMPALGLTADCSLAAGHSLEAVLVWLFTLTSASRTIMEHGHIFLKDTLLWPSISVSVDASTRAAIVSLPNLSIAYEDLAKDQELEALYAAPLTLEVFERRNATENRSGSWDSSPIPGRGMRVIRTITQAEIGRIADALTNPNPDPLPHQEGPSR